MKKTQILIALIIVSSLSILNSCSSDTEKTPKETVSEETPIEVIIETLAVEDLAIACDQSKVNSDFITNWENVRTNLKSLKEIFNQGNKFSFTLSKTPSSNSILAIPFLNKENKLGFYIVDPEDNSLLDCSYVTNSPNNVLPDTTRNHKENIDNLSYQTATIRVNRFSANGCGKKEDWITSNVTSKTIYKHFRINTMDIEYGIQHDCYLALRRNITATIKSNGYIADLVIVNTQTGNPILPSKESLEDVTTPTPPFPAKF